MDERLGQSVEDGDLSKYVAQGWYVSGTYALTGDAKVDGLDQPKRPLFQGGIGAIEVAVRVEQLEFGSDGGSVRRPRARDPTTSETPTARYLRRQLHQSLDCCRATSFAGITPRGPSPAKNPFWSRVFRLQLVI
jgi:hypothetical protein